MKNEIGMMEELESRFEMEMVAVGGDASGVGLCDIESTCKIS